MISPILCVSKIMQRSIREFFKFSFSQCFRSGFQKMIFHVEQNSSTCYKYFFFFFSNFENGKIFITTVTYLMEDVRVGSIIYYLLSFSFCRILVYYVNLHSSYFQTSLQSTIFITEI